MQILTYPVGVVVGLLPVVVELGVPSRPATLLLDGRTACHLRDASAACMVDLGSAPKVHLLELVRKSPDGRIVERAIRWVNRPGAAEAEIQTKTTCPERSETCDVVVGWAHPDKLGPEKMSATLEGKSVALWKSRTLKVPARSTRGSLLTVDLEFPDGRRAFWAGAVGGRTRGDEPVDLAAIVHERATCDEDALKRILARYAAAGVELRAFEPGESRGEWEVTFVAEPQVEPLVRSLFNLMAKWRLPEAVRSRMEGATAVRGVVADGVLREADLMQGGKPSFWLERLLAAIGVKPDGLRTVDAVAAAAWRSGASPRRRAVVLLLGDPGVDTSRLPLEGVRRFAAEIFVPLEVWRLGDRDRPEWKPDRVIATPADFEDALAKLRVRIACEGIAWVEADYRAAAAAARGERGPEAAN